MRDLVALTEKIIGWTICIGFVLVAAWCLQGYRTYGLVAWKSWPVMIVGNEVIYSPILHALRDSIFSPVFYALFAGILLFERFFPADPQQKIFSPSLATDAVWLFATAITNATIQVTYVAFLQWIYHRYFDFLTVHDLNAMSATMRFVFAVVLIDLLNWTHHYIRHKIPIFWEFHTIHHSQKHLNMFTDLRYHVVEYLVSHTVWTIPFLVLEIDLPQIVWYIMFTTWYSRVYHSNIKSNYGLLRYVFVTPQSHRVHHSVLPQHRDKNFGVIFSIWDRMFGTQYKGYEEYPPTGVEDEHFPHEDELKSSLKGLLLAPFVQMVYPFYKLTYAKVNDLEETRNKIQK